MSNATKVITGSRTRWSYVRIFDPRYNDEGKPEYTISLIIPKTSTKTIEKIQDAIKAAYEEGAAKLKGTGKTVPALATLRTPLRDGDLERPDDPAYANSYFVNAKCRDTAPDVVDVNLQKILDRNEVYSGCYGRADISFYAYNNRSKGIGCWLHGLQKISDGEPLGNRANVEADFAVADDDEDDFLL